MKTLLTLSATLIIFLTSCNKSSNWPAWKSDNHQNTAPTFVRLTAHDLFPEKSLPMSLNDARSESVTLTEIIDQAQKQGLKLCSDEDAQYLFDHSQDQPIGEIVTVCGTQSYTLSHFGAACGNGPRITLAPVTLNPAYGGWAQFFFRK